MKIADLVSAIRWIVLLVLVSAIATCLVIVVRSPFFYYTILRYDRPKEEVKAASEPSFFDKAKQKVVSKYLEYKNVK